MKKIKIFLASSEELKPEREQFEIEIYRKCKSWFERGIFLHLDIWEDVSARVSISGSQSEYNKLIKDADLFVFLAYSKVGMYTAEEFEHALGNFQATQKPFIFTYFKTPPDDGEDSLADFKKKLKKLKHFQSNFSDFNDLWKQFNKELDRLEIAQFAENKKPEKNTGQINFNQKAKKIVNMGNVSGTIKF